MQGKRPRILVVESAPRVTGSVRSLASAASQLHDQFDFVAVGTSAEVRGSMGTAWAQFEFAMPRKAELLTFGPRVLSQARRFAQLAEWERAELVHVNDLTNIVPLVARWLGAKYRLAYHVRLLPTSYIGPAFTPLAQLVMWGADVVIAVSRAVASSLPRPAIGLLRSAPVLVIPDGLPVPAENLPRAVAARGHVEVLYLSHFHRGKGHNLAVEALAIARREFPLLHLKFAGSEDVDPSFSKSVRRRVAELGLSDAVTFAGPVTAPTEVVRDTDIVLNLSESESFSMVVLEAMMHAKPVVASRCGGPEELLSRPGSGELVPNRGVREAASALVELARNPIRRVAIGAMAREVAMQNYDVVQTSKMLARAYDQALRSRGTRAEAANG